VAEYDLNAPWHVLFRVFRKVFGRVGLKGKFLKFFLRVFKSKGIYLLRVKTPTGSFTEKLIKY
jgi:hypothetical protein